MLAAALTGAALVWAVIIVAAPAAVHARAFVTPAAVIYAAASRICHQQSERSFRVSGVQLPVCARCAGLYLSAAAGALAVWLLRRPRPRVSARQVLLIAALPTAITWILEHMAGVPFSNTSRALAALPLGASAGWLLVGMLRYDSRLDGEQILYS
jgi:uncharacterized membrane protein